MQIIFVHFENIIIISMVMVPDLCSGMGSTKKLIEAFNFAIEVQLLPGVDVPDLKEHPLPLIGNGIEDRGLGG